jgi:putative ABC transport system permease protein
VVVQFSISVFLITGTVIITRQMSYIKHKELGYNQEQALEVPLDNGDIYSNMYVFKQTLQSNSNIATVCMMSGVPGGYFDLYAFEAEGQNNSIWKARTEFADFEFVQTLGLKIIAGRDLSSLYPSDTLSAVLVNRAASTSLGFTPGEAIGKWLRNTQKDSARRRIVGVVEDFNFASLRENIEPLVISPNPGRGVALVRLPPGNLTRDIELVKSAYARAAPGYSFEYTFLLEDGRVTRTKNGRQFSFTRSGGDAITWVISTPGT